MPEENNFYRSLKTCGQFPISGTVQFMELDAFDSLFLDGKANQEAQNPSKYLLYQDPMAGIFDQEVVMSGVDTGAYVLDGMI